MNKNSTQKGLIFFLAALLAGCNAFPKEIPIPQENVGRTPEIIVDPETGFHSVEISILIYNVEGLPWPIRKNRKNKIRTIGYLLGEMRAVNAEPDIIMLQEAFTMKSNPIPEFGGYPNVTGGPKSNDKAEKLSANVNPEFSKGRSFWKGEKFGKWVNGGLAILSNFPILERKVRPFKRHECAGFDCIANKGAMLISVQIPDVPETIEIFNTHMNSRDASGVSDERSLKAHNLQADEVRDFLQTEINDDGHALILGGDFNTKQDHDRLNYLAPKGATPIVRFYCTQIVDDCNIRMSFDSDEPWLDTQDLQAFFSGTRIKIRPISIEAMFDRPIEGKMLSDHDGYLVYYRLSWDPADFEGDQPQSQTPDP